MMNKLFAGLAGFLAVTPMIADAQGKKQQEPLDVPQKDKTNVLFIVCDDLNCDMGSWDDPVVKTPHLDRLRQNAVRFSNAYCQFPLSGPTRASFLTGYSPERTGVMDLTANFRTRLPNAVTLPQLFKNNGYFVARVGKVYHANVPADIGHDSAHEDNPSWMEKWNPIGKDKTMEDETVIVTPQLVRGKRIGGSVCYQMIDCADDELTDGIGANIMCKLIRDHRHQPFFLAMGFYRPHSPYVATKKYFDMYPWQEMTLPEIPAGDIENKPIAALLTTQPNYGASEEALKKAKAAYYAGISYFDAQIGKLLDQLEASGVADNTVIVFVGDNGYNLGQHGQWQKQMLFEHSARVPLMIAVPGMTNGKLSYDHPVEQLDIYPTIANLCQLQDIPQDLDGHDLTPLLKDQTLPGQGAAFTQQYRTPKGMKSLVEEPTMGYSIRTDRYRLVEWNEGAAGGELYDYETDPNEYTNLYGNKKYKKIQDELSARLRKYYADMKEKAKKDVQ